MLGSKDELNGNQSCTAFLQKDGTLSLRLRLPNSFAFRPYLLLPAVKFAYGHQEILAALSCGQALSYRFKRDEKGWRLFVSTEVPAPSLITNEHLGRIGVDINSNHLSL